MYLSSNNQNGFENIFYSIHSLGNERASIVKSMKINRIVSKIGYSLAFSGLSSIFAILVCTSKLFYRFKLLDYCRNEYKSYLCVTDRKPSRNISIHSTSICYQQNIWLIRFTFNYQITYIIDYSHRSVNVL